jgi:hypothetical protein
MPEKQERPPSSSAANEFKVQVLNTDDLDIPAFLRNRSHR